jgi:hypothetical protein
MDSQMQAAIQEHAQAIAKVTARVDGHDDDIARIDASVQRHEELISTLREMSGRVATKDDISSLRGDISDKFDARARDAHNSIPTKLASWFGGLMLLLTFVTFVVDVMRHGR